MTIDLNFWLQLLIAVASIVIPGALVTLAAWTKAHYKLAAGSNAANILDLLVTAGTQFTASALAKAPTTIAPVTIKSAAIGAFLNDLSASTQAAMKLKGVTAETLAQRIDGAVTMALAVAPAPVTQATGVKP